MKNFFLRFSSFLGILVALSLEIFIKDSSRHPVALLPYFKFLLVFLFFLILFLLILSFFIEKIRNHIEKNGPKIFVLFIFLSVLNILTAKMAVFPVLLFPSFDNILSVFVESRELIFKCIIHSFKLLFFGVISGVLFGFLTGVALGFSRRVHYWLNSVIRVVGPIPATAWIPFSLVVFPSTFGASVFIIVLSVWFPVVLLTSSGIQNVPNSYFEVGKTLGSSKFDQIFKIAVPAALPDIFQGIFFGVCSSFIALMSAEMFGAKAGIGWFINMEKEMADFKGVYAGLILIALFCNLIIAILLKIRKKILRWQNGLIKK